MTLYALRLTKTAYVNVEADTYEDAAEQARQMDEEVDFFARSEVEVSPDTLADECAA